jgi:hypothetical protein
MHAQSPRLVDAIAVANGSTCIELPAPSAAITVPRETATLTIRGARDYRRARRSGEKQKKDFLLISWPSC